MFKVMDEKKLKTWEKIFKKSNEDQDSSRRIQEIEVLLSELGSLKPGALVYRGTENTVLFASDVSSTKADLKKEKNGLRKKSAGPSSGVLAF